MSRHGHIRDGSPRKAGNLLGLFAGAGGLEGRLMGVRVGVGIVAGVVFDGFRRHMRVNLNNFYSHNS